MDTWELVEVFCLVRTSRTSIELHGAKYFSPSMALRIVSTVTAPFKCVCALFGGGYVFSNATQWQRPLCKNAQCRQWQ